jgi:uncharacterized membrane protein YccC
MLDNRHILRQGDGTHARHMLRDWLRRQLLGITAIGLDGRSLIFGTGLFALMTAVAILAIVLGFGAAAILAALSVMLVLLAAFGGPLRSDLLMMAWFGPTFILAVGGVHLLANVSHLWAIPLIVAIVFIAGLLPAFGARYTTAGTALVLGVLIAFGLQLPSNLSVVSIFGGIALAVIVITLVRFLMGVRDPSLIARKAIARVLVNADIEAVDNAGKTLRAVRPKQWMSEALSGAEAYCVARLMLTARLEELPQESAVHLRSILDEADKEARDLVGLIEPRKPPTNTSPAQSAGRASADGLPVDLQNIVASLWRSLDRVRTAALRRDNTSATIPKLPATSFYDTARAIFSWDSSILRDALRCASVILVVLIIASLTRGNPLNATFLTTSFAIMQPTPLGTAAKALQRTAGAVFGVCIAGGLALIMPPHILLPLAILALFLALPFMLKNMTIYYAMLAVMTLLLGISTKRLPLSVGLIEYLLYIIVAVLIALLFIFVVPRVEPDVVKQTRTAMADVRSLLLTVGSTPGNMDRIRNDYILAARAVQNLFATTDQLTKTVQQQRDLAAQAAKALQKVLADVSTLQFRPAAQRYLLAELSAAEQLLNLDNPVDPEQVVTEVMLSIRNKIELHQSLLVAHALAAHRAATQMADLSRVSSTL